MTLECSYEDLASRRIAWLLWGLPAVAIALGAVLDSGARTSVWTLAFLVAGLSCVANAGRCGRLHCYLTGPLYLLLAAATLLTGFEVVTPRWGWIPSIALAGTVLAFVPEWFRGKYRMRAARQ